MQRHQGKESLVTPTIPGSLDTFAYQQASEKEWANQGIEKL